MRYEIYSLFSRAREKVITDFNCEIISERLQNIEAIIETPQGMAKNLRVDNYRRFLRIPAYYDPNKQRVHINEKALKQNSEQTLFIICYHELIHGASTHRNYQQNNQNIFCSGVKIERYSKNKYSCENRLLNEGFVQYFTNVFNNCNDQDYAYPQEVGVVRQLVKDLGETIIRNALTAGCFDAFVTAFEQKYPVSFLEFSQLVDMQKYTEAEALIQQPLLFPFYAPATISVA